eukprot:COSAG01_NODE_33305_length_566_cov_1.736617_1_plen_34_part_10
MGLTTLAVALAAALSAPCAAMFRWLVVLQVLCSS